MPKNTRVFNYRQALKSLRGKISFDYSMKGISNHDKTGEEFFSSGQKSAIKKAWKAVQEPKGARFITLKHLPRESQTQYHKRLAEIKREFGQGGNSLRGLFLEVGKKAKVSYTRKNGLLIEKEVEDGITTMRVVGIKDRKKFLRNPAKYIRDLAKKYPGTFIAPVHSTWIKRGFDMKTHIDQFIQYIKKLLNKYSDNIHALTGFAITRYPFFEKNARFLDAA